MYTRFGKANILEIMRFRLLFCKMKKLKTGKTGKEVMNPEVVCQRER